MAYIHFTEQQKQAANNSDIASFLRTQGETLKREGKGYSWQAPSGKVSIKDSQWYSHYEQEGGGAILFVQKFFGQTFPEAVTTLLGNCYVPTVANEAPRKAPREVTEPPAAPPKNSDMRRVYGYLTKERFIDREVIYDFAHMGLLYEDAKYHNAVFLGLDGKGEVKHVHRRSTVPNSEFKNNADGSVAEYSFHFVGESDRLYVFEAPIDMLAYISLHKENWKQHSYVALCSTADRAMVQMLKDNFHLKNIYLCLDHDGAGIEGAYRLADSIRELNNTYSIWRVFPKHKDWDEDLKALNGAEAIPASTHKRMQLFTDTLEETQLATQGLVPRLKSRDVAQGYKGKELIQLIWSNLAEADDCYRDSQRKRALKNASKTIMLGYMVFNKNSTLEDTVSEIKGLYFPHKDYDSVAALNKTIQSKLAELEKVCSEQSSLTESEWKEFYKSLLAVARDCLRQCGNIDIQREKEEMAKTDEFVYEH